MNCEQFEARVQHLLDERASLLLDLQIQKHARQCDGCADALMVFQSFSEHYSEDESHPPCELPVTVTSQPIWHDRQLQRSRIRVLVAAAAVVLISLSLLVPEQDSQNDIAQLPTRLISSTGNVAESPGWFSDVDVSGWVSTEWASDSYDLDSLSFDVEIDLLSFVPEEPLMAMQNLPATLQTIEPIYQYWNEIPAMNRFSSGINYTFGLLQLTLPDLSKSESDDLGQSGESGYFVC